MGSNFALNNKRNTIEDPMERQEMWTFNDTEYRVDKKVVFTWNTLFQAFQNKEFQVFLQDDLSTKRSKSIYKNIAKSGLHREVTITPFLPCTNVIEWMT